LPTHEISDRLRRHLRDVEWRRAEHSIQEQYCVTQIMGTRTRHQSSNVLKMGIEGGYQRVSFSVGHAGQIAPATLHAKQRENLGQPASGSTKLTSLPPAGTGSVTSQDGFVCLGETQPMLAQPSAKPIGHAHVPPDSFRWILFLMEGLGDKRQVLCQWPRLQSGKCGPLLEQRFDHVLLLSGLSGRNKEHTDMTGIMLSGSQKPPDLYGFVA
jgi:hypothetical protein